jgi:hypothetical protein
MYYQSPGNIGKSLPGEQYFHNIARLIRYCISLPRLMGTELLTYAIHKQFNSPASRAYVDIEMLAIGE